MSVAGSLDHRFGPRRNYVNVLSASSTKTYGHPGSRLWSWSYAPRLRRRTVAGLRYRTLPPRRYLLCERVQERAECGQHSHKLCRPSRTQSILHQLRTLWRLLVFHRISCPLPLQPLPVAMQRAISFFMFFIPTIKVVRSRCRQPCSGLSASSCSFYPSHQNSPRASYTSIRTPG
jgi:hypothetical protein